eukprot:TRINITY_DN11577_c0_g1_i2.p1 TRINITY_DN11577_c0_g1~~TRINITY_DN11577_c0_g1_i2.p1  ORF type:complete len:282 (+),score=58.98 TRINITY_DN11577_c0_g1_i2:52-897(+)
MNIFRLAGDSIHVFAMCFLLAYMLNTKSCNGYSGKTQLMYLAVFITRYLDLITNFISVYNTTMKVMFISIKATIVYLIYGRFKQTHDKENDTFRFEVLIIPCAILAIFINHESSVMEIMWTFSIYMESVLILPQLWMIVKSGKIRVDQIIYLVTLGCYRALYIANWKYRYDTEGFYDILAIVAGCLQTSIYVLAFCAAPMSTHWVKEIKAGCADLRHGKNILGGNNTDKAPLMEAGDDEWSSSLAPSIRNLDVKLQPGSHMGLPPTTADKKILKEQAIFEI